MMLLKVNLQNDKQKKSSEEQRSKKKQKSRKSGERQKNQKKQASRKKRRCKEAGKAVKLGTRNQKQYQKTEKRINTSTKQKPVAVV